MYSAFSTQSADAAGAGVSAIQIPVNAVIHLAMSALLFVERRNSSIYQVLFKVTWCQVDDGLSPLPAARRRKPDDANVMMTNRNIGKFIFLLTYMSIISIIVIARGTTLANVTGSICQAMPKRTWRPG
jgi:hypothetical protein